MAHGIIRFTRFQRLCITKRKDANVKSLKMEETLLVIDPDVVPVDTALTYIRAIAKKGVELKMVIFGTAYQIKNVPNVACFKQIKEMIRPAAKKAA